MAETQRSYLVVQAGDAILALPATHVLEICRVPHLTAGEDAQVPALLGFAVLRGEVLAVLDLATLIHASSSPAGPQSRLVRVRLGEGKAALAVDAVIGLHTLTATEPIPLPGGGQHTVAPFDQAFARLLELATLVPEETLRTLATASARP